MSGFQPPPNAPPPAVQDLADEAAAFSLSLKLPPIPAFPGAAGGAGIRVPTLPFSICGFKLPGPLPFGLSFSIPPFAIPLPKFALAVGISCDGVLNEHPLNFAAGVAWGGGRISRADPDPDAEADS
jgi:hypothetical protein